MHHLRLRGKVVNLRRSNTRYELEHEWKIRYITVMKYQAGARLLCGSKGRQQHLVLVQELKPSAILPHYSVNFES